MLRDEIEQYTKLTGDDGLKVPIMKIGAYLDGYNKGLEILDKIRAEIEQELVGYPPSADYYKAIIKCLQIINKYKAESEVINGDSN